MENHIELSGFLAGSIEMLEGPTSNVARFRIKVPRVEKGSDSFNCVVENARLLARLRALNPESRIHITGRLRSRFFRTGSNLVNVTEVLVLTMRKK